MPRTTAVAGVRVECGPDPLVWTDAAPELLRRLAGHDVEGIDGGAVVVQDASARIVAANATATRLLRLTRDELMGRTSLDPRWQASDSDGLPLPGERHPAMVTLRTGEPVTDYVIGIDAPGADGTPEFLWLELSTHALLEAGTVAGVVVRFRDITHEPQGERATQRVIAALRRAVRDAEEAEDRFRLLAESSADMVMQTATGGVVTWVSPSVVEVLGWSPDEVVGRLAIDLLHPEDVKRADEQRRAAIDSGADVGRLELRFLVADGTWRWMSALSRALRDERGTVVGGLTALRDAQREIEQREELRYLAEHDGLTGLVNRTSALGALGEALRAARATGRGVGLLYVDVDRFKEVNDSYGHAAGDRLLVEVSRRLGAAMREGDVVARIGGDEFLVVLPGLKERSLVERRAHAVLRSLAAPPEPGVARATVSVGLAFADGGREPERLVRDADQALYRAKESGRARLSW